MSFDGFPPAGLAFLRALERNNDRAWFAERKATYERTLLAPLREFVDAYSASLGRARIPVYGTAQRSIFRIYRDVRFSPDKRPYKTHVSAYLSRDAERDSQGGLYLHVAPRDAFLGAAFYQMTPAVAQAWRTTLVEDSRRFANVVRALERRGLALDVPDRGDALVRMPRGYEAYAGEPFAHYLKWRSFVVHRPLTAAELGSADLVATATEFARSVKPLLQFGWAIVDGVDPNELEDERRKKKPQRREP